jgi:hypothetical protein
LASIALLAPAASADTVGVPILVPRTGVLFGVACPTATTCEAVGDGASGEILVPITDGIPGAPIPVPGTYELRGIACESATSCVAVGDNATNVGVVVPISGATPGAPIPVPGTSYIQSVACQSATSCTAVGGPIVPITGTTPGTPTFVPGSTLTAIACQTPTSCTAVGEDRTSFADIVVPITNGTPGAPVTVSGQSGGLDGIACQSAIACTAVGVNDHNFGVVVPINDGMPGTSFRRYTQFQGVACETITACEGVGPSGVSQKVFVVPIVNGTPGHAIPAPTDFGHASLNAVACGSATGCEVVGTTGYNGLVVASCTPAVGQGCAELTGPVETHHATISEAAVYCIGTAGQRCVITNQVRAGNKQLVRKTITIKPGHVDTLTFGLGETGKRLLRKLGKLRVTLTISQSLSESPFVMLERKLTLKR